MITGRRYAFGLRGRPLCLYMPGKSPIGPVLPGRLSEWAGRPTFCLRWLASPWEQRDKNRLPIETNEIAHIVEPALEAMGYRLVRVMLSGAQRPTLQLMAERRDDAPMSVEDCAEISRSVSALLDVADPIAGAYTLEVSSPGIDRPLVRPEDYERFAGFEARIDLSQPKDGRKRFRGRLLGRVGDDVRLAGDGGEIRLPFTAITRAKLVLTDDLLALTQPKPQQTTH
jgi:ribosome maturation factor RimP